MWDLQYQYRMKFICKNPECDRFDIEEIEPNVIIGFKNNEVVYDRTPCPSCKVNRDYVPPEITNFKEKNIGIKQQFGSVNKNWSKPVKNPIY